MLMESQGTPNQRNLEKEQSWKTKLINHLLFPHPLPVNASFCTTVTSNLPHAHQTQKCCLLLLCLPSHLALAHHLPLDSAFMSPTTPCSNSNRHNLSLSYMISQQDLTLFYFLYQQVFKFFSYHSVF